MDSLDRKPLGSKTLGSKTLVWTVATVLAALMVLGPQTAAVADAQTRTASATTTVRGLSQEQVQNAVVPYRLEIRQCVFVDEAQLPPNVMLVTELHIEADGSVRRARMHESNTGQPSIDECVVSVLSDVHFPPTADGRAMAVRYPFIFVTAN